MVTDTEDDPQAPSAVGRHRRFRQALRTLKLLPPAGRRGRSSYYNSREFPDVQTLWRSLRF